MVGESQLLAPQVLLQPAWLSISLEAFTVLFVVIVKIDLFMQKAKWQREGETEQSLEAS